LPGRLCPLPIGARRRATLQIPASEAGRHPGSFHRLGASGVPPTHDWRASPSVPSGSARGPDSRRGTGGIWGYIVGMSAPSNRRFPEEVEAKFREGLHGAALTLRGLRNTLPWREDLAYALQMSQVSILPQIPSVPTLRNLRAEETFRSLLSLALTEPSIWQVLLDSQDPTAPDWDRDDPVFGDFVELTLLRICAVLELKASSYRNGTDKAHDLDEQLDALISFLALDAVERQVIVPLLNVDLSSGEIVIPGFGRLRRARGPRPCLPSTPRVELDFSIRTGHFVGATQSPVWQEIRKRVTLVRLAAQPLAAYNHFSIQSFDPWEEPLVDSRFSTRFWGAQSRGPEVPCLTVNERHAAEIGTMLGGLAGIQWDRTSPWRLASDRLDDAVFKLECRSPDAILDIVIGLESVLTEPESRQESTHKVAVRAARYLERTVQARRDVYRLVKQAYRARSTLAHGQTWDLDSEGLVQVQRAAQVLARTLGCMALGGRSRLELTELDLS
jgi:hypothetical protein